MACVHLGRLMGPVGFTRTVAIKSLRPDRARDPEFVSSFVDEARLAACIRHPNVIPTLDVVVEGERILVVMEYVHGESLSKLLRAPGGRRMPLPLLVTIGTQMLFGLHAAHEATGPGGEPLRMVHRDVSPQNVIVGTDGVARLLDFGIAKAAWRAQDTRDGALKGKLAYMAPEQLRWEPVDRRTDIFAASVVLWEAATGERLFATDTADDTVRRILAGKIPPPTSRVPALPPTLDALLIRGLSTEPSARFASALEMATALEAIAPSASAREVGAWVSDRASAKLRERAECLRELELASTEDDREGPAPKILERLVARDELRDAATDPGPGAPSPRPTEPGPRRRGPRWLVAGVVTAAFLASVAAYRSRLHRTASVTIAPASASANADPPPTSGELSPTPPPSGEPSAAPPIPRAPLPGAAPSRSPRPAHPPPAASRPPKRDCSLPYIVGPDGIRRFRPECI
jgi:serine/threonine-protein kinase